METKPPNQQPQGYNFERKSKLKIVMKRISNFNLKFYAILWQA